jgi:hypothetical protein
MRGFDMSLPRGRLPQVLCLASSAVLVISYYLKDPTSYAITGAGLAVIAMAWAWMLFSILARPDRRTLTWYLLTASTGLFTAAAAFNFTYGNFHHGTFPFPGPADVMFLMIYPIGVAGVLLLSREVKSPDGIWKALGYGVLLAAVAGEVFTWPSLWTPITDAHISVLAKVVSLAYPAGDLFFLAVALAIFLGMRSGKETPAAYGVLPLIVAGAIALLAADTAFTYTSLRYIQYQPSWINSGWFAWFLFWALAALEPPERKQDA